MDLNLNFTQILKLIKQLSKDQKKQLQSILTTELEQEPQRGNKKKRQAGGLKGFVTYMAKDFDAPLEDMKPYME